MRTHLLLCSMVLAAATPSAAQKSSQAHMEACTVWHYTDERIGTRNDCDRPVAIMFMAANDQNVVEADVPPGGWFDSGVIAATSGGFIFTACPVGYRPSVRFALENKALIAESLYNCVPGRPNV